MKKVAFVHDIFPGGGAERVTIDIAKYLSLHNLGYKCYVFTPDVYEELYTDEVKKFVTVITVSKKREERGADVERLIKSEGIDLLVQAVQQVSNIKEIRERTGCKVIFANHGEPFWQKYALIRRRRKSIFFKHFWRLYWKRYFVDKGHARDIIAERTRSHYDDCDVYTVLCDDYKLETCKAFGISPEESKIRVIGNSELIVNEPTLKKEKIIMFCGRLEHTSKRPDRLLNIWGKIQHRLPDYRLLIVGDGDYREPMEKQIAEESLERVDMVGRQANVDPYYRKASIVCLTSQTEGWGLCLTEAQAHGCIPVAFGCTAGVKDILSPSGTNGFIVTPFDEDEYAETLLRIAAMSEEEQNVIRKSAIAKRANYTPEVIMKKWADLFEELLAQKQ